MWIRMNETYSGPLGLFAKGLPYDLPQATLDRLPAGSFTASAAPWDAQKQAPKGQNKMLKGKYKKK